MQSVTSLSWDAAQTQFAQEWVAIVTAEKLNPTLHPGWMDAAVRSHGVAARTRVLRVGDAAQASAFVPVIEQRITIRGLPMRALDLASNLVSYHAEVVSRSATEAAIDSLLDYATERGCDVVRLANIVANGPTAGALATVAERRRWTVESTPGDRSPYLVVDRDWDSYLATRDWKFRSNMNRPIKQMKKAGETAMRWFEAGADLERLLADILEIEAASWKTEAGIAISQRPIEIDYHKRMLEFLVANNALFANVVYMHERPVGYALSARWGDWIGQLKTSYSQQVRNAGARVVDESVRRAFEVGCKEYDFLGDAQPHKLRFTDKIRPHASYTIFRPTLRSRAARVMQRWFRKPATNAAPQVAADSITDSDSDDAKR